MSGHNFPKRVDSKTSCLRITVPENLDLALEGLIRKVLREQPKTDYIHSFAAEYFETLLKIRDKAGAKYSSAQVCPFHNDEDAHEMVKLASNFNKPVEKGSRERRQLKKNVVERGPGMGDEGGSKGTPRPKAKKEGKKEEECKQATPDLIKKLPVKRAKEEEKMEGSGAEGVKTEENEEEMLMSDPIKELVEKELKTEALAQKTETEPREMQESSAQEGRAEEDDVKDEAKEIEKADDVRSATSAAAEEPGEEKVQKERADDLEKISDAVDEATISEMEAKEKANAEELDEKERTDGSEETFDARTERTAEEVSAGHQKPETNEKKHETDKGFVDETTARKSEPNKATRAEVTDAEEPTTAEKEKKDEEITDKKETNEVKAEIRIDTGAEEAKNEEKDLENNGQLQTAGEDGNEPQPEVLVQLVEPHSASDKRAAESPNEEVQKDTVNEAEKADIENEEMTETISQQMPDEHKTNAGEQKEQPRPETDSKDVETFTGKPDINENTKPEIEEATFDRRIEKTENVIVAGAEVNKKELEAGDVIREREETGPVKAKEDSEASFSERTREPEIVKESTEKNISELDKDTEKVKEDTETNTSEQPSKASQKPAEPEEKVKEDNEEIKKTKANISSQPEKGEEKDRETILKLKPSEDPKDGAVPKDAPTPADEAQPLSPKDTESVSPSASGTTQPEENGDATDTRNEGEQCTVVDIRQIPPQDEEKTQSKADATGPEEELCAVVDSRHIIRVEEPETKNNNSQVAQSPEELQIKTIQTHYYDTLQVPETVTKELRVHDVADALSVAPEEESAADDTLPTLSTPNRHELASDTRSSDSDDLLDLMTPTSGYSANLSELSWQTISGMFLESERQHSARLSDELRHEAPKASGNAPQPPEDGAERRPEIEEVFHRTVLPTLVGAVPMPPRDAEEIAKEESGELEEREKKEKKPKGESFWGSSNGRSFDSDTPFISIEVKTVIETQVLDDENEEEGRPQLEVKVETRVDLEDAEGTQKEEDGDRKETSDGQQKDREGKPEDDGGGSGERREVSSGESDSTISSAATEIKRAVGGGNSLTVSQSLDLGGRNPLLRTRSLSAFRHGVTDFEVWSAIERELEEAASKIQARFRRYKARKKLQRENAVQITTEESSISGGSTEAEERQQSTGEFHDSIVLSEPPR